MAGLWSHLHLRSFTWRKRLACKLVPDWYDRFAEVNRLRSQNKALLDRIKTISERSEDRDFADAFERLLSPDELRDAEAELSGVSPFQRGPQPVSRVDVKSTAVAPATRLKTAADIMDGSR